MPKLKGSYANILNKLITDKNISITMKTIFHQDEKTADVIYLTTNPKAERQLPITMP